MSNRPEIFSRKKTLKYWDTQARWQKTWLEHCHYHRDIIPLIADNASPGWRVLDIGAGNGVLALALREKGCEVTALEPSQGMRALLLEAAGQRPLSGLRIETRTWEEIPVGEAQGFHLILACNSLHLTSLGLNPALAKAFQTGAHHVCLITELDFLTDHLCLNYKDYRLVWSRALGIDSSLAYHHLEELWEHWQHQYGRAPDAREKNILRSRLIFEGGHYWLKSCSLVGLFWWSRATSY